PAAYGRSLPQYDPQLGRLCAERGIGSERAATPAPEVSSRPERGMDPAHTTPFATPGGPAKWPHIPGYVILEELDRGGMGVVYRGHDPDLNRSLAIKVLLHEHRENPELHRRFLEEAQIMSQLQHPGVAPLHEIGRLDDGRPFFSMKQVKGKTLAALLEERGEAEGSGAASASAVPDNLPRILGI